MEERQNRLRMLLKLLSNIIWDDRDPVKGLVQVPRERNGLGAIKAISTDLALRVMALMLFL